MPALGVFLPGRDPMTPVAARSGWIRFSGSSPRARVRLFCFPYSGGNASIYHGWSASLAPEIETCPVELPGHGVRLAEKPFLRMEPLLEALAGALLPHLDRPFAFFGHSLGALIAFELARRLGRERRPAPVHLFASGHPAPRLAKRGRMIHALPEPDFVEELRALRGTPEAVLADAEMRQLILPALRADFELYETHVYQPGERVSCPITALGGLEDENVSRADLEAWGEETAAAFAVRMFPGDHFFLGPSRRLLLAEVARSLGARYLPLS